MEYRTTLIKRKKGADKIEQMCGIMLIIMQHTADEGIKHEFSTLLAGFQGAEPSGNMSIKRMDKAIIQKLDMVRFMTDTKAAKDKILSVTSEVGLMLLERNNAIK